MPMMLPLFVGANCFSVERRLAANALAERGRAGLRQRPECSRSSRNRARQGIHIARPGEAI